MKKKSLVTLMASLLLVAACEQPPVTDPGLGDGTDGIDNPDTVDGGDTPSNPADGGDNPDGVDGTDSPDGSSGTDTPDNGAGTDRPELTFDVVLRDFNSTQEAKMLEALRRAQIVLNSEEFKQRVLNFTWNGQKQFNDNKGQTNAQIYETIMNGAETLYPTIDHEMDLDITLYYSNNSTVGYTYPDTVQIWVNNKFFSTYNYGQVAANAVHEWTHKLGYGHDYYNNSDRPYSVPYGVGTIIRELVNKM